MKSKLLYGLAVSAALGASAMAADFPVDAAGLADAKALVGRACSHMFDDRGKDFPGYSTPRGFLTVTLGNDGWVFPMEKQGARFAFLIIGLGDQACRIADVAVLPDAKHANAWLQCHERDALVEGVGMRLSGRREIVGWWTAAHGKLTRMPAPKPGALICQEPETGTEIYRAGFVASCRATIPNVRFL
ncbi:MAG: hypothetical protein ACREHE_01735 [Rhizomicrobium sp.]